MNEFYSAHVVGDDWRALCDQALNGFPDTAAARLAVVYVSAALAGQSDRIVDYLRENSGIPHWVGCVGMGLCSNGRETYDEAALSILITPFQDGDFRLLQIADDPTDWLTATRVWRQSTLASVALVHADPADTELPAHVQRLSDGLDGGFLIGGIASSEQLPVQIADRAVGSGISGVLFSGQVGISTGLSQGCALIGSKHRITRCKRNVIETLDDRPALEVFTEDIGETLAEKLNELGNTIFAALPVSGSDTGDYLVRNLAGFDPDRGLLAIAERTNIGSDIQFALRDASTARGDLARMVEGLLQRLPGEPRGALYHSCLGRGRNLFGDNSAEMRLISKLLGPEVPLAGFYANGEISHNRLYGYTGILTIFS